ncbi:MAG TPA: nuclear transport factor 2 family protein [Actinomycetota bacterium]
MHPNEKIARDADAAMERGDVEAFLGYHAEDVIVHIAGKSSLAGTYKGKEQFQELFGRFMERSPGFAFEAHDYLANDDHVVLLQRSHYERGDERLDVNDVFIMHVRDGKIAEFWIISEEQDAFDAFFG